MTPKVQSVRWRIMVRLLPMLALIFIGVLYWLGENLGNALYSTNLEIARRSNMMVVNAVELSMLTDEETHSQWDRVSRKIARDETTEIQVVNIRGEALFSTDPDEGGTTYHLDDSPCSVCHENGSKQASTQTAFIHDSKDAPYQVFAAPLNNAGDCRTCHSKEGPKLGMVFVQQSLEPIHEQVRAIQIGIAIAGVIAMVLTISTIRMLLGQYLDRPLRRLVAGARAIGTGNLQHTIELSEQTELAVLADTLNASTVRLAGLQKELVEQERLAAIGETVAGLAHCLKNTLNGLRAGQYVIDRGVEKNDTEKLKTGWRVMKEGVHQVERLTSDMLYCVKERVPEREPTDPNEIIREIIDLLREMATEKEVELRAALDEEMGVEALDRTMIYRAILNLVTNAIDACTESESGDLVILRSQGTPEEIVLTVEDNGIGMSDAIQARLFTRFFSTKSSGGTGLGLSVVKKITEEHGGTLRVKSEVGKGTEFHIHLPRTTV
ncbi:MAG: HAMP domain-containing histidine kinase [Gemmatimonadetes bacterium]|jgi:signal transduction histidine kinase|nr:HAMP domain-containing histidine kinase [Gemmatimonadota bacterium]